MILQQIWVNRTHDRSELWLWQDFGEGDLEGTSRDQSMEQPWREALSQHPDPPNTSVWKSPAVMLLVEV